MRGTISGLAAVVLSLVGASRTEAQFAVAGRFPPPPPVALNMPYASAPVAAPGYVTAPYYLPSVAGYGRIGTAYAGGAYIPPYSYYVVPNPLPARRYVGYGANDPFPFHGNRYGRPNDAWSWPYLSGGYYNAMARYYSPPL